ncbi:hypothetical protein Cob_v006982 [Colletotrichum orbiculare MAFF 240422]|uniref:Uncharacterized protein n=1 Tax=Colletotrichum orbiculare (strain 104-T / ATCC 96160 / CBS 514.97 / LARS 414 / MAFF 240422) TaxID=1213857 RepID=A0A484FSD6_COLOR|nr:hypothetical protein Cob_v006982 [Colletotrichum orbiculare MAFF 240422]
MPAVRLWRRLLMPWRYFKHPACDDILTACTRCLITYTVYLDVAQTLRTTGGLRHFGDVAAVVDDTRSTVAQKSPPDLPLELKSFLETRSRRGREPGNKEDEKADSNIGTVTR